MLKTWLLHSFGHLNFKDEVKTTGNPPHLNNFKENPFFVIVTYLLYNLKMKQMNNDKDSFELEKIQKFRWMFTDN